ncbi:MAG: alpha-L-fucosidase [Candidatus Hodarchaeota archaeon]
MEDDISKISQKTEYDRNEQKYVEYLKNNPIPVPLKKQLDWLDLELGMFIHFGINTYHDMEWSDGTLDPKTFNPVDDLDCNQWVQVAKDLGAGYIVLTAKHHDGFCLWQTETTDYSVKSSPWKDGKGDVVREFIEACKRENMPHGLYLSPWDRHEPCYPDKEAYDKFYEKQLTELCTLFDTKFVELWFDGAGSVGREYDWKSIIGVCKKHQPQAIIFNMGEPTIRWAGNEAGTAPYPLWNVISKDEYGGLKEDKPDYLWLPAECDMPIRFHTWFYNTKNEWAVSPPEELMKCYVWSVGRGANLLLNITPDRRGLMPDADWDSAKAFGAAVKQFFSNSIASTSGKGNVLELSIPGDRPSKISHLIIQEDIEKGQRVKKYVIEYQDSSGNWEKLVDGSTIGHKKIDFFKPIETSKLKLEIMDSYLKPVIKSFNAYYSEDFEEYREYIQEEYL